MSAVATGVMLLIAFNALGLGPALLLRRWTALPWRYVSLLTLLMTCVLSYAVFWISFVAPTTRPAVAAATFVASAAMIAIAASRAPLVATLWRPSVWGLPLAAALFAAACSWPLLIAGPVVNDRFSWKLPSDNIVPGLLARRIDLGESTARPVPPLWPDGDRASERPPLQAAVVVAVGSVVPGLGHEYQLLATLCQAQWLPALVLVAVACGVRRRALIVVAAACVCSGFFFVNTIYTWPKLSRRRSCSGPWPSRSNRRTPTGARTGPARSWSRRWSRSRCSPTLGPRSRCSRCPFAGLSCGRCCTCA